MIDAAAQREEPLEWIGNVGFNLFRRHAVIERCHHHHRNLDLRKQIHRHARHGDRANNGDDHAQHDDEERIAEGEF
jgi:hypothetical protein